MICLSRKRGSPAGKGLATTDKGHDMPLFFGIKKNCILTGMIQDL